MLEGASKVAHSPRLVLPSFLPACYWFRNGNTLFSLNRAPSGCEGMFELQIQGESGCQFNPRILIRVGFQETRIDLPLVRVGQIKMQSKLLTSRNKGSEIN